MKNKFNVKHAVASFVCGAVFFSGIAMAQTESVKVSFEKLRFMVQGVDRSSADGMFDNHGTKVPEAIQYKDTTYVPVRQVGEMLNMPVHWDGGANTVWIGGVDIALKNASGASIGHAVLSQTDHGVNVHVEVSQLTPGKHGFHLHEKPIAGNDFKTAGGHFNPMIKQHGHDNPEGHHMGDLPNLDVKQDGTATADFVLEGITLEKGKDHSVWGKSLVVHAQADDFKTDPSGNSGDRIAGGSIVE